MEIEYLKELRDYPSAHPNKEYKTIKPISLQEITELENLYNEGQTFPKALRELLFLAGKYCYVLDYGLNTSQQELQEFVSELMVETNNQIRRHFYAIDVYNAYDQFLFIYLDDGDNPSLYEAYYGRNEENFIRKVQPYLTDIINKRIICIKQVYNPF